MIFETQPCMAYAVYQDDRDKDESAVAECASVDDAMDALVHYFRATPDSYAHMQHWRIIDMRTGTDILGTTILLD